jgi:hypothetical protein
MPGYERVVTATCGIGGGLVRRDQRRQPCCWGSRANGIRLGLQRQYRVPIFLEPRSRLYAEGKKLLERVFPGKAE